MYVFAISFRFRNPIKRSHRKEELQYPLGSFIYYVGTCMWGRKWQFLLIFSTKTMLSYREGGGPKGLKMCLRNL